MLELVTVKSKWNAYSPIYDRNNENAVFVVSFLLSQKLLVHKFHHQPSRFSSNFHSIPTIMTRWRDRFQN
ncbi:hypothetical protein L1987_83946 [Smallanthus sonchifolius]|uniref:Uncharacterized protein n=1 Tax=Smallanthus sonchifolius TaxID=185202 RepID=A0ACB8YE98_9ASTR|nr:hypothetical protein L1987_83946 [Smallanthus sonchifolius]